MALFSWGEVGKDQEISSLLKVFGACIGGQRVSSNSYHV